MNPKRKSSRISGREGSVRRASGGLLVSPLAGGWGSFIWGIRMRDMCRGQIPKGQAEDLRLHMKVMGSHLSILGSRVTQSDLCFRKITLATVWKGDRLGGYFRVY